EPMNRLTNILSRAAFQTRRDQTIFCLLLRPAKLVAPLAMVVLPIRCRWRAMWPEGVPAFGAGYLPRFTPGRWAATRWERPDRLEGPVCLFEAGEDGLPRFGVPPGF